MTAKPPSKDIGLLTRLKIWMFKKKLINKVKYKNVDDGYTYVVRTNSHVKKLKRGE